MITTWLRRPFPFINDTKFAVALSILIGVVCFIILTVYRPWDLDQVDSTIYLLGFGGNATIALLVHLLLLPKMKPTWFCDDHWTIRHQALLTVSILVLIAVCNYLYNTVVGSDMSPQYSLPFFLYMTTAVGMLPILLTIYVTEVVARNRNTTTAQNLTLVGNTSVVQTLSIQSDNTSDPIVVIRDSDLIYAQADGNYTKLITISGDQEKQYYLRLSLKQLHQQVESSSAFVRCHRSYLVNKNHMEKVTGNARSMVAHLPVVEAVIPISRGVDLSIFE